MAVALSPVWSGLAHCCRPFSYRSVKEKLCCIRETIPEQDQFGVFLYILDNYIVGDCPNLNQVVRMG